VSLVQAITAEKTAGFSDMWEKVKDVFRGEKGRAKRRSDYLFSPKAGTEKWKNFPRNVRSVEFVKAVLKHPDADAKLKEHAKSMHRLSRAKVVGKVESSRGSGKTYEIKKMTRGRLGCTCNDWRYKGSIDQGHDCKHVRAFKEGRTKVAASFNAETSAFFDELSKIVSDKEKKKADPNTDNMKGPFSTLLTQDEEPQPYHPKSPPPDEPDIITRRQV
jgi:hypothetical protein